MSSDQASEVEALAEHQLACLDDFATFARSFWTVARPGRQVVWGWHLEHCAKRAQHYMQQGHGTLVVVLPFRSGKSTLFGVLLGAWDWLHRPHRQWISIGSDTKNVSRDSRATRRVILSEQYQSLARIAGNADRLDLARDQNEKTNFVLGGGGGRRCTTTFGSITGGDGDVLHLDDLIDAKEVEVGSTSQVNRRLQKVVDLYDNSWTDRMNPDPSLPPDVEPGVRIIVAQRVHLLDLPGVLIERAASGVEDCEIIHIPEEYDSAPNVAITGPMCEADPRTEDGALLLPELRGRGWIEAIRSRPGGERKVATRLNGHPIAKGGGDIRAAWFRQTYDISPQQMARQCADVIGTIDCAEEVDDSNDFTAFHVWGRIGSVKVLLHRHSERMTIERQYAYLSTIRDQWPTMGKIYVEKASNGKTLLRLKPTTGLVAYSPHGRSKAERAHAFILAAEADEVMLPAGPLLLDSETGVKVSRMAYDTVQVWTSFGAGSDHDDDVDAAAMACEHYAKGAKRIRPLNVAAAFM
jgi:phage terminase large subunit-like protein